MTFGGVDSVLQYYEFNLSSDDADHSFTGSSTSRNWPVFKIGGKRPLQNVEALKILEVEIPFTWYLFSASDILTIVDTTANVTKNLGIGTGNFGITEIINVLQTNSGVVVSFDSNTLKFKVSLSNNNNFTVRTNSKKLAFLLGLTSEQTYTSTGTPASFTFPSVAQLTGPNFIYVCSDTLGHNVDMYLPKSLENRSITGPEIARIQVTESFGKVIFWRDPDPQKYFDLEQVNTLNEIDFYLKSNIPGLDDVLDLNGAAFSLKLAIIENDLAQAVSYSGLEKNDRVVKRIRAL